MTLSFAITWDYRCPFARNAHEHVLAGLAAGADWDVTFVPFSLGQAHVEEGQPDVWTKPEQDSGILALQAGVVVRDKFPGQFTSLHRALFAARHDDAQRLDDPAVVRRVLEAHGIDSDAVFSAIESRQALSTIRSEHEGFQASHQVWGVPTFIVEDQAVFIRLMSRPDPVTDGTASVHTIERVLDLLTGWTDLNEFKHTSIPR
jgi:predicted DsbA family dithiol-disulfide isomerase